MTAAAGLRCLFVTFAVALEAQFAGPPPESPLPRAQQFPISGRTQPGTVYPVQTPVPGQGSSVSTLNPNIQVQGVYQGSVPGPNDAGPTLALTLRDAVDRGVRYNLGAVLADNVTREARAIRLASAAQLLPDINGELREAVQQINLAAQGLRLSIPGFHFPTIIGPFNNFDARARMTESLSFTNYRNLRSSQENLRSAELSAQDSRELVTLAVAGSYLQLIAAAARIQTAQAQIDAAQAIYNQAVDRNRSGISARIDVSAARWNCKPNNSASLRSPMISKSKSFRSPA
jgi:hypothetical protein